MRVTARALRLAVPRGQPCALSAGPGPQGPAVGHLDHVAERGCVLALAAGYGPPAEYIVGMGQIDHAARLSDALHGFAHRDTLGYIFAHVKTYDLAALGEELDAGDDARQRGVGF